MTSSVFVMAIAIARRHRARGRSRAHLRTNQWEFELGKISEQRIASIALL